MRRVRGVGLALVDPGRVRVVHVLDVVEALVDRRGGVVSQDTVLSGLVLGVLMRIEFGKSPLTGFAASLAIGQGRRADAKLRTLEETA